MDPKESTKRPSRRKLEPERQHFRALVLSNPNYFGNLENSTFKAVKALKSNTSFEALVCAGLSPAFDRLEAVLQVKQDAGYGGDICTAGTFEYVRFYVDLHDNGVWHDVGLTSVRVHDIPGDKPLCYAVRLDFNPFKKWCFQENIVKVRAILSWNVPPPANAPGFTPVYGNRLDVEVQIQPGFSFTIGDFLKELELIQVKIPDPIGPVVKLLDPEAKLKSLPLEVLSLAQKKELYKGKEVPVHRFAFAESQKLLASADFNPGLFTAGGKSPLVDLGLAVEDIGALFPFEPVTDGNTGFEELRCAGLRPGTDLLEAVLTIKKNAGYSGGLCTQGSREYVAFWIDFGDGGGFTYMGTSTVRVHDLGTIPSQGVQYAVFLKTDLSKHIVPCTAGPRVVRLRAILSWETPPPPANPNYIPVWGNREECLVQLRPGQLTGHIPIIETVGNIGFDDIDQTTGLATGNGVGAAFTANQSPFGGVIKITGRIGDPPDSFNGPEAKFKYKIEVSPVGIVDDWHALTNKVSVKVSEFLNGVPQDCDPGLPLDFVCDVTLTPTDDGDGLGDGWYDYLEDYKGPWTRNLVQDQLASWSTGPAMEGLWKIRITAKDTATSPPTVYNGFQEVRVRIDNTVPTAAVAITGATFNGNPIPPPFGCGKFPVGTILTGTYEVHDPGTSSPNQHFGGFSLDVIPDGPANGAVVNPASRSFPIVPTNGEGPLAWTLDTAGMEPCGFVIRLVACDRTIYNSGFVGLCQAEDIGFCLEKNP
ncbi:MAG: hypothetical protein ACJ75H_02290 [Thermoanaerobaculia bacterium]